jgi:protein SCO1/2
MRSTRIFWLLLAVFLVVDVFFILLIFWSGQDREQTLGVAPSFALVNQAGEPFSSQSLTGKIYVADFFFTSCAGPCPVMNANMARLQRAFPDNPDLHFVSISVDPETDTPERLKAYGEKLGADFSRWNFLTGPMETIQQIAVEGFKVGSVDDPVIHSTRLILVDREGNIRGYYSGIVEEEVASLEAAIDNMIRGFAG